MIDSIKSPSQMAKYPKQRQLSGDGGGRSDIDHMPCEDPRRNKYDEVPGDLVATWEMVDPSNKEDEVDFSFADKIIDLDLDLDLDSDGGSGRSGPSLSHSSSSPPLQITIHGGFAFDVANEESSDLVFELMHLDSHKLMGASGGAGDNYLTSTPHGYKLKLN